MEVLKLATKTIGDNEEESTSVALARDIKRISAVVSMDRTVLRSRNGDLRLDKQWQWILSYRNKHQWSNPQASSSVIMPLMQWNETSYCHQKPKQVCPKLPSPFEDSQPQAVVGESWKKLSWLYLSSQFLHIHRRIVWGTSVGRVILFGTIPTTISDTTLSMTPPTTHVDITPIPSISPTIPPLPDYTPASPDYSPASDTESDPYEDPSLGHIPPLPATSPFLSSIDDSSDSDIPDTPPLPTHGTPFTKTTLSTQRSPVASGAL
ncbi:hypothetical protein Tco_0409297 [Tanacetum coccineum]